jgi:phosphoglycolate phosphatase
MKNVKAVLFDLDGLLIQSWPFICASYNYVLTHLKLPQHGMSHPKMRHCTLEQAYAHLGVSGDMVHVANRMHLEFQSLNLHLLKPFPDTIPTLRALEARCHRAVVSNRKKNAPDLLKHCDLLDHFDLVIGAEDVSRGKPHPEGIFHALDYFGLEPYEVVMVGDTTADVEAGKRIGAWTVAVDGSDCAEAIFQARPDFFVKNLGELVPLLS